MDLLVFEHFRQNLDKNILTLILKITLKIIFIHTFSKFRVLIVMVTNIDTNTFITIALLLFSFSELTLSSFVDLRGMDLATS